MAANKKRMYLQEESVPFSRYVIHQVRKKIKETLLKQTVNMPASTTCLNQENLIHEADNNKKMEEPGLNELLNVASISKSMEYARKEVEHAHPHGNFSMDMDDCGVNDEIDLYNQADSYDEDNIFRLLDDKKASRSIKELINDEEFFKSIVFNFSKSHAELLLMVLKYSIANSLSITGISNLLKFVNILCGKPVLPETRFNLDTLCNSANNVTFHATCTYCTNYIGTFQDFDASTICHNCNREVNMSNKSNRCFFAMIDPSDAIRDTLENNENYYDYVMKQRQCEPNHITDVYDGMLYRKFVNNLKSCDRQAYATVIFNTDGAPVFESSNYSIWPIYIMLNEIPLQKRLKSTITIGLWFGLNKPKMDVFLDIFVNNMNHFSTVGIPCTIKKEKRNIKIYALIACVDSMARPPMNGSSLFNAHFGCDWCTHEGVYGDGSMRYPYRKPLPKARDRSTTIVHATEAVRTKSRISGITSASPLLNLNKFDIIEGFTPDYMHCYVSGVAKQVTEYILKYLTNNDINMINDLFESIKSPHQIGRLARSLKHRGNWKAREYENWVLYYSIPLLSAVVQNQQIMQHWSLLVDALHICLRTEISSSELNRANEMLHQFVSDIESIYSLRSLTYNVHQLLHLPASVYNWGPLYSHSTYPFEAANHKLLKAIHCAKGVILQIVRYDKIQRSIQMLEESVDSTCVSQFCQNLTSPLAKKSFKISNITYLGTEKFVSSTLTENFNVSSHSKKFFKIVFNGSLFTTAEKENTRSCNYFARLDNHKFVKLLHFVVELESERELTICKIVKTRPNKYSTVIREVIEFSNEICIETKQINQSCIYIESDKKKYIIPMPNQLFY